MANEPLISYDANCTPSEFYKKMESWYGMDEEYKQLKDKRWRSEDTIMLLIILIWLHRDFIMKKRKVKING
jgi:hypothetical protein